MAIRLIEGFENRRLETYLDRLWSNLNGNEGFSGGRRRGSSLQGQNVTVTSKTLVPSVENTWIVCWSWAKRQGVLGGSSDAGVKFFSGPSANLQCELVMVDAPESVGAFKWELRRGATVIDTSAPFGWGINPRSWHYFQLKVTIRTGVNGAYELRHFDIDNNMTVVMSGTMVNLADQGADGADGVILSLNTANTGVVSVGDFVVLDSTGTKNNDFPAKPFDVVGALPDGDGNRNEWDTSSGSTHWILVDDAPTGPVNDNEHVQTDEVPEDDLFTYASFTGEIDPSATVVAVQVNTTATMETSGSRNLRPIIRDGASEATGATFTPDMTLVTYFEIFEDNPVTAGAWTQSEINGMEVGIEAVS